MHPNLNHSYTQRPAKEDQGTKNVTPNIQTKQFNKTKNKQTEQNICFENRQKKAQKEKKIQVTNIKIAKKTNRQSAKAKQQL